MWGPGVLGGHSPQAFLITGLHAAKRAADTVNSYNLSFNIYKEDALAGEHATLAAGGVWGVRALRLPPYALYPTTPTKPFIAYGWQI